PQGYRDRSILELMYSNGIRASELLGLELGRIDFKNGTAIIMGKGMKERVVPIGKTAMKYLETYVAIVRPYVAREQSETAVFLNPDGGPLTYAVLRRLVKKHSAKAGLPDHVTPHTLRRSCTTELLRGGAGLYHVKELLGHTSLDTLKHYTRLTITDLRKTHAECHPRERNSED
ncbi:MAG: tyrosine-type recombinase/integrase, partial [bacterium]